MDLLDDFPLLRSKPAYTYSHPSIKLCQDDTDPFDDIPSYRILIDRLIYLKTTRPNITYITQKLIEFLSKPSITHYNATCRVLRYLKSSPGKGLFFPWDSNLHLLGFSDSDWAGCKDTRHSISGSCFFIVHSLISWHTKKQKIVSRSSFEVGYSTSCNHLWTSMDLIPFAWSPSYLCQTSIVIKKVLYTLMQISCFMKEQNTWKLISTLYEKSFKSASQSFFQSHPKVNLLISTPSSFCHNHLLFSYTS